MVEKRSLNRTLFVWILTSSMSSLVYSQSESITVNKIRTPQTWARFSTDYVRCFCNLPQCVSTGYMCLSSEGGCFSSFLEHEGHHSKDYRGRHGCLEFLSEENRAICKAATEKKSLTQCCHHDMCNHVDSPQTKDIINNTQETHPIGNLQQPIDYTDSQVWFRAATIAVPVCGAVILFVLIALAVKILRSENQNHATHKLGTSYDHQHGCDRLERTYDNILRKSQQKCLYQYQDERIQVPLLIQNEIGTHHTGNKNETNAKLNLMHEHDGVASVVLDIEKNTPKCSKTNLVNHVNTDKKCSAKDDKNFN